MIAPVQSRDPFVSHVVTVSAYDTQHSEAARYCLKRNFGAKRGLTCARREDESVWPQVTIWSLQRVLRQYAVRFRNDDNFHLSQIKRRDHRSILTQVELEDLAATMRESALAGLPFSRSDRNSAVCDILLWRQSKNSTGGRAYVKLSRYARHVLQTKKAGKAFWNAFFKKFPCLTRGQAKETAFNRAKQCSKPVAEDHIKKIKETLSRLGIYDLEKDCFVPGKLGNLIWLDECPNFFKYNLKRGSARLVTYLKGLVAKIPVQENRGTFTIDAALGGDGYLYDPHLLFAQDGITTDMLPEGVRKHQWLFISNNDCGVQTGTTFFERCTLIITCIVTLMVAPQNGTCRHRT